jgi:diadenosine tetraphosphatase ApaH/serine/threonine PP2A family protein phosphatase
MRVAILSDIHSNLQALTKALAIIDRSQIDEIYCLGDIVGYGAHPNDCVNLVRERARYCILGNHDLAALDLSFARHFNKPGRLAASWTHKSLTKENCDYLHSLPYRITLDSCTLVHASPDRPEAWQYILSLSLAAKQFKTFTTPLCFIGHTHVPFVCGEDLTTFTFKPGMRFLINVGSVGQPRDGNPQLSFGIFDFDAQSYENIRSDYDVEAAAAAINKVGLPPILASRLFLGQ